MGHVTQVQLLIAPTPSIDRPNDISGPLLLWGTRHVRRCY
jgi:hypothetical protein